MCKAKKMQPSKRNGSDRWAKHRLVVPGICWTQKEISDHQMTSRADGVSFISDSHIVRTCVPMNWRKWPKSSMPLVSIDCREIAGNWMFDEMKFVRFPEKEKVDIQPLFITVDPQRDTNQMLEKYTKEFSPKLIGLTGTQQQIASVCKKFRVYFSAGPKDQDNDYIVRMTKTGLNPALSTH